MDIFISWSGERSGAIAQILKDWLRKVIQAIKPWVSLSDLQKGGQWPVELATTLQRCKMGIVCLVPGNTESPWLLFEAGAIAKSVQSKVWTFLVDLESTDITGPLSFFQHTVLEKTDVFKLIQSINANTGKDRLDENLLHDIFETMYPELQTKIKAVPVDHSIEPKGRKPDELLEEILETVRRLDKVQYVTPDLLNQVMQSLDPNAKILRGMFGDVSKTVFEEIMSAREEEPKDKYLKTLLEGEPKKKE